MSATISMTYVQAVFDAIRLDADAARAALGEAGIAPALYGDTAARVTERQFATLYRALAIALDDEMLGLYGRPLRPGALKFTCLGLLGATGLEQALHRWTQFLRLLQDDVGLEVRRDGALCRVALVPCPGAPARSPLAADLMLKLIHGVASWLVGRALPLDHVDFAFERPAFAAEYRTLYPGPVRFEQPASALAFAASCLALPVRRTAQEVPGFVRRAPEGWMFPAFAVERLALRVREQLSRHLLDGHTASQVARALNVSLRTLHRRLAEEGTSFQQIKDELRRDLAIERLTRTAQPIGRIGAELGFDSAGSFHRAFRTWTGQTPGAYRAALSRSRQSHARTRRDKP